MRFLRSLDHASDIPTIEGISLPILLEENIDTFSSRFTPSEVDSVVLTLMGTRVLTLIHLVFRMLLPSSVSSFLVALIPKVGSPLEIGDFNAISLFGGS